MKIWHITRTLKGGAGQYALRLSAALREAGHDSCVLVANESAVKGKNVLMLKRIDTPLRRFGARVFRSLSHRMASGAYHAMLGPERYACPVRIKISDVIHLHGMTGWIGVSGLRRIIPDRATVFQTMHGPWAISGGCVIQAGVSCDQFKSACEDCPLLRVPWKKLARLDLETKRNFASEYNIRPIANSDWMRQIARESTIYRDRGAIDVIPPIVDHRYLVTSGSHYRQELRIAQDRYVVSLGALSVTDPHKGIPEFLRRLSQKPDLSDKMTVLLFGEGSISIPENLDVRELGSIADPMQLSKLFHASDAYVSASTIESFGMTCL